jgi:hypothetical protein
MLRSVIIAAPKATRATIGIATPLPDKCKGVLRFRSFAKPAPKVGVSDSPRLKHVDKIIED